MMFYKIGPQNAEVVTKDMGLVFSEQDLVNMDKFKGTWCRVRVRALRT